MIGRRKVLKLLGITPLAAKATAEKAALDLTTANGGYKAALAVGDNARATYGVMQSHEDASERYRRMSGYMRLFGKLPDHVERYAREEAKYVAHLDFDLVAKRSWSLAAKIHEQRERNFRRKMGEFADAGWYERSAKLFKETSGFDWSW